MKAYKSQVIIYNSALGLIQKYEPDNCYILGRKITKDNKKYNSFYTLGKVNTNKNDKQLKFKIKDAISWIKRLKKNGSKWNPEDMEIKELFPNMSNKNDYPWHLEKKKLAKKIKELTLIWKIGVKERIKLHKMGIFCWNNIGINSNTLKMNNKDGKIFDKILNINQSNRKFTELSEINHKILNNPNNKKEFYVDFETTGDLNKSFNDIINYENGDKNELNESSCIIYMIGVGWYENRKWNFKNFVVNRLSFYEEKKIIDKFLGFIGNYPNNIIYHWSNAEPILMKKSLKRYNYDNKVNWCDLLKIFKEIPIVVKGSFSYGLKSIAKTMYKQNLIKTNWVDTTLDGLDAMLVAWIAEEECVKNNIFNISEFDEINDIVKYNEIDCKVMWDILNYIRKANKIKIL